MKTILVAMATSCLITAAVCGTAIAQDDDATVSAMPVELFTCSYADGRGPEDLAVATAAWSDWADGVGIDNYAAWMLTKFYAGPDQEFDYIWLGTAPTAKELGVIQDNWLATGGDVRVEFEKVGSCDGHSNFATVMYKKPAPNDDPSYSYLFAFSDCKIADGKNFDDVEPAITAWTKFRTDQNSESGHWILFPAYGGGGEDFDFKWVVGHYTHEAQGVDWDSYDSELNAKLFDGLLDCDAARVYNATNIRRVASNGD